MSALKTEKPTPRRIDKAKRKGKVARSVDFVSSVSFCVVVLILCVMARDILKFWIDIISEFWSVEMFQSGNVFVDEFSGVWEKLIGSVCCVLVPVFIVVVLVVAVQVGPLWVPVRFDLKRINAFEGMKSFFSKRKLLDFALLVLKFSGVLYLFWIVLKFLPGEMLPVSLSQGYGCVIELSIKGWKSIMWFSAGLLAVFGLLDLFIQKKRWVKDLMMSKDEVKKDYKDTEGDPELRSRRKQLYGELVVSDLGERIASARVVIVNPTRYAVALKYDNDLPVPVIHAKGSFDSAAKIKDLARKSGVPILRHPPLARALFLLMLDQEIPSDLYQAVAEILVYISRIAEKNVKDLDKKS